MPGFIRRFSYFPGTEVLSQIEGVNIIDLAPTGSIEGVSTGVVGLVGEFPDMSYATDVDGSGNVTTFVRPVAVTTSQDLLNKVGSFDPTLGDFGRAGGNGFAAIRNKRFSRLIIAPVNLTSNVGARFFRELPLCSSQEDALPVVPVQGATITPGREFRNSTGGRVLIAKRINFTAFDTLATGLAGQLLGGASAATQVFVSASAALQVWQANTGGTVFVDQTTEFNDETVANFTPWDALGTVADFVAFGMAEQFTKITLNNTGGTQGVGGVVTWEYWNGSAWAALTVTDGTVGFTAAVSAGQTIEFSAPSDWAENTINAVPAFYIRARLTTIYTTAPVYDQGFVDGIDWAAITRDDGDVGLKKGDVIVIGYDNLGAIAPTGGGTYRVATDAVSGTNLTVERLDGANFAWTAAANVPWRVHVSSDADSAPVVVLGATGAGGYDQNDPGGFSTPVRPVTNATGGVVDGVYPLGELVAPISQPPALTGDTADPLSGLAGRLHPITAMAFVAALQGLNAPNAALIDAAYTTALAAMISDATPVSEINLIVSARTSANIRSALRSNALSASSDGLGRIAILSPELTTTSLDTVVGATSPGVGAYRAERVVYSWPGARTYIPEAVGTRIKLANGLTTVDGVLDIAFSTWTASLMSNIAPERNIGQAAAPVPELLASVLGLQTGVQNLEKDDYITLRNRGVCALRIDRVVGPIVQSGITTSLISGEKNISRRRMADFIQDSIARRLVQFCKLPLVERNKDSAIGEIEAFMQELKSENNPPAQRIIDYQIDDTSGNTLALEAKGIFVVILSVRTMASMDFIALQTNIGENVTFEAA